MAEQSSPEARKHSPLKTVAKKIAPVILAATVAFSSDSKAPLTTPITPPLISQEQGQVEAEKILFKPRVTIIDAGLSALKEGIIQNEFFPDEEFAKRVLGNDYLSAKELEQEFGNPINWVSFDVGKSAITTGKYKQVLTHAFIERYFSHGDKVIRTMEGAWNKSDLQSTGIELLPLQKILDASSVKEIQDSLGNQGISISFDPQRIIELLKTDTNRVVNMSFQVGDVDIFLEKKYISIPQPEPIYPDDLRDNDGNLYIGAVGIKLTPSIVYVDAQGKEVKPTTPDEQKALKQQKREEANQKATIKEVQYGSPKIVGAYDHDKARENLPKLFAVANAYPDKLFFAAAGNEGEDFEDALKKLKGQKPKNLLIVGQWTSSYGPTQKVFGADIYVDNGNLGDGSSISTPILAAYAETLFRQGLSQEEVIGKIKANSHQENYDFEFPEVTKKGSAMIFDPTF